MVNSSLTLTRHNVEEMVAHCRRWSPEEACGILGGLNGTVTKVYCATNTDHSPKTYTLDPQDLFQIIREIDNKGWDLLAIFHSHPATRAYPSATDLRLAFWPESYYVIISLADEQPDMHAFRIVDGQISEDPIVVLPD